MLTEKLTLHSAYGAVMIMDSHFGRPITQAVLSFDGKTLSYRIKPDGYYVLTQPVPAGSLCQIACPGYATVRLPVELDENGRFFAVASLNHLVGQPQLNYIGKYLGSLLQGGKPLAETSFTLALSGRIPALMLIEDAPDGATVLLLNTEQETRLIGQSFSLPEQPQTRLQITGQSEVHSYSLSKPLPEALAQGQQLTPLWDLDTNAAGEFVFPYKPHLQREAEADITITLNGLSHSCKLPPKNSHLTLDLAL